MIISASRRTDIPAFYAEWFINRLRDGYLLVQNPFNTNMYSRVELSPDKVEAIVFWTKNPRPLMQYLKDIDRLGYKYYFQFTLTGYPKVIEPSLPSVETRINTFKELSDKVGPQKVIWRYDPIVISDITDEEFNLRNFEKLSAELHKYTKRSVISYADFYKKVLKNVEIVTKNTNVRFYDINSNTNQIYKMSSHLSNIAKENSLNIYSCAETIDLSKQGIEHGKCIDDKLIKEVFGLTLNIPKDKYQR